MKMMSKMVVLAMTLAVMTGCATQPEVEFVRFQSEDKTPVMTNTGLKLETVVRSGSGIQWNEDYVVTARHVKVAPLYGKVEYTCESGCDIQFVRRKANGVAPTWRDPVPLEQLSAVGASEKLSETNPDRILPTTVVGRGQDIDVSTRTSNHSDKWLRLADIPPLPGMSGGPVYGKDLKVVGMLTGEVQISYENGVMYSDLGKPVGKMSGYGNKENEGKLLPYSVYVPYDVIQAEWVKFQQKKMNMAQAAR